jgi:hypothetical protein
MAIYTIIRVYEMPADNMISSLVPADPLLELRRIALKPPIKRRKPTSSPCSP